MFAIALAAGAIGLVCTPVLGAHWQNPLSFGVGASNLRNGLASHLQDNYNPFELASFNADEFKPSGHLNALSDDFTTLNHPAFPKHSVRIKHSDFCDGTIAAYTGYIDVEARHLFFYFFESRNDPTKDDVILWTTGGPGGSSSIGLFIELGPCRVVNETSTKFHRESWNSNANIFFIDQPIGVGFSYAEHGEYVSTTEDAAKDVAAFVAIFFEHFTQFKGRGFHMAGESYGGRYIPLFASAVYDQNAKLVEAGGTPVNLTSIMIGNGYTDQINMVLSYYDMQCTPASMPPVFDISTCVRMKQVVPRCHKLLTESCIDIHDQIGCWDAFSICKMELWDPYISSGMNPYDITKKCEGNNLCYTFMETLDAYLRQPSLRHALGVDPAVTSNNTIMSTTVEMAFNAAGDTVRTSYDYVAALLERDVRVLIYVGTYDWSCNWVGNERWVNALEWSGKEKFGKAELRQWTVDGQVAGKTRTAGALTWATVDGGGHMAPHDKPKESLELVNRWIAGEPL